MEGVPRLPMLRVEIKELQEYGGMDWMDVSTDGSRDMLRTAIKDELNQHIRNNYSDDPEKYKDCVNNFLELQASAYRAIRSPDFEGCNILKKYYGQLHYMQSRFPFTGENALNVGFAWGDAFSGGNTQHNSFAFEQTAIIFNLGAIHSYLGSVDNRTSEEGTKVSCVHFQCAAGFFQYLADHLDTTLSPDVSQFMLKLYINVMLGQGQECLLEKSMQDNRKHSIIAKISQQVVDYYQQTLNSLNQTEAKDLMGNANKTWTRLLSFKITFYSAVTKYYLGNDDWEQEQYGQGQSYFAAALESYNEAVKVAKNLKGDFRSKADDALKYSADVFGGRHNSAKNDNDFIYHEKVPDKATLSGVKGASLVKPLPFDPSNSGVTGPDIFSKLVPLEAHLTASSYSEEKAKLLRPIIAEVEEKDSVLEQYKRAIELDPNKLIKVDDDDRLDSALIEHCASLSVDQTPIAELTKAMKELSNVFMDIDTLIDDTVSIVQSEEQEAKQVKETCGKTVESLEEVDKVKKELQVCKDVHDKAGQMNDDLHTVMKTHIANLKIVSEGLTALKKECQLSNTAELITEEDREVINLIGKLCSKVVEMEDQRQALVNQLRNQLEEDDVTSALMTKPGIDAEDLFQEELKKHDSVVGYIQQNLAAQENILTAVTEANVRYAKIKKVVENHKNKVKSKCGNFLHSCTDYTAAVQRCGEGTEFFKDLLGKVQEIQEDMKTINEKNSKLRKVILEKHEAKKPPPRPSAPKPKIPTRPASKPTPGTSLFTPQELANLASEDMDEFNDPAFLRYLQMSGGLPQGVSLPSTMPSSTGRPSNMPGNINKSSSYAAALSRSLAASVANIPPTPADQRPMVHPSYPEHSPAAVSNYQSPQPTPMHSNANDHPQNPNYPPISGSHQQPYQQMPRQVGQLPAITDPTPNFQQQAVAHRSPAQGVAVSGPDSGMLGQRPIMTTQQVPSSYQTPGVVPQQPRSSSQPTISQTYSGQKQPISQGYQPSVLPGNLASQQVYQQQTLNTSIASGSRYQVPPQQPVHQMPPQQTMQQVPSQQPAHQNQQQPGYQTQQQPGHRIPPQQATHQMPSQQTAHQFQHQPGQPLQQQQRFQTPEKIGHNPSPQVQHPMQGLQMQQQQVNQPGQQIAQLSRQQQTQPQMTHQVSHPPMYQSFQQPGQQGPLQDQYHPSRFNQQPNKLEQHSAQLGQLPSQLGQQPNQLAQQSNQLGQQPNQPQQRPNQQGQQPSQLRQQPNQFGQQPNQLGQQPNQLAQQLNQPNQLRQLPNQQGQQPNQFDQQPNQLRQQPNQLGQQPNPLGHQPGQQPNPLGNQPGQQPNPRGNQPGQQPNPLGNQPGQQPNPLGNQPGQQPNQLGNQPGQQPNPLGNQPGQQPNPLGYQPGQQPNKLGQHPNLQGKQPNQQGQQPNQFGQQPNKLGHHPNPLGQQLNQLGQQPNQLGQQPNQLVQQPNQLGQQPNQLGQQPNQLGQQPNQLGQQPNQLEQQPNQPGQQPNQLGQQQNKLEQQPNQPGQQPNQLGQQQNKLEQQPNQPGQQPNQLGQQQNKLGQHPNRLHQQPNQLGQQPNQLEQQPNQLGQQPNQLGQQPNQSRQQQNQLKPYPNQQGQQPNQLGQQPNQLGQQPNQQMQQPNQLGPQKPISYSQQQQAMQQPIQRGQQQPSQYQPQQSENHQIPQSGFGNSRPPNPQIYQQRPGQQPTTQFPNSSPQQTIRPTIPNQPHVAHQPAPVQSSPKPVGLTGYNQPTPASRQQTNPTLQTNPVPQGQQPPPTHQPNTPLQRTNYPNSPAHSAKNPNTAPAPSGGDTSTFSQPLTPTVVGASMISPLEPTKPSDDLEGLTYTPSQPLRSTSTSTSADELLNASPESEMRTSQEAKSLLVPTKADSDEIVVTRIEGIPYNSEADLMKMKTDTEAFQRRVSSLLTKASGSLCQLDKDWKQLSELQEKSARQQSTAIGRCSSYKNRFQDVLPFDQNRIILNGAKDDYINASLVDGISRYCPRFIATQSPLASSCGDFWTMIHEHQVTLIVMLVGKNEIPKKCAKYWPDDRNLPQQHGPISITFTTSRVYGTYIERTFTLTHAKNSLPRSVTQLQYTAWPEHGLHAASTDLLSFMGIVYSFFSQQRSLQWPIVVHCENGVSHTGTFCSAYACIKSLDAGLGIPDILEIVEKMRERRKYIVQEKAQLKFLHDLVCIHALQLLKQRGVITENPPVTSQKSSHVVSSPPASQGDSFDVFGSGALSTIKASVEKMTIKSDKIQTPITRPAPAPSASTDALQPDINTMIGSNVGGLLDRTITSQLDKPPAPVGMETKPDLVTSCQEPAKTNPQEPIDQSVATNSPSQQTLATNESNQKPPIVTSDNDQFVINTTAPSNVPQQPVSQQGSGSILDQMTPEAFTLGSEAKEKKRITKQDFLKPKSNPFQAKENSNDPFADLDPLWGLKK